MIGSGEQFTNMSLEYNNAPLKAFDQAMWDLCTANEYINVSYYVRSNIIYSTTSSLMIFNRLDFLTNVPFPVL